MKLLYRMSLTTHWSSLPVVRSQPHTGPLRYVRGANVYDALELAGGAQGDLPVLGDVCPGTGVSYC